MDFDLSIPRGEGVDQLDLTLSSGQTLFVLGANGTGKSSLTHRAYAAHRANAVRISALRRTWFTSNAISLSPEQKRQTETQIQNRDAQPDANWQDHFQEQRPAIAIYELVDAENVRARKIARAVDDGNHELAVVLSHEKAPIKAINDLLRLSNIQIEISIRENQEVVASKAGSEPYSIAQLSDGERNALLVASSVLTTRTERLIVIDEPERHLHRSIISPLLTLLISQRPDCAFLISTHDVFLPLDNPDARTILVRGCTYANDKVTSWDADLVPPETEVDEDLKRDILGARRKILFVEGGEDSLDKPIYSLVFPNVTVIAKFGSRDVEHAVAGIRGAADLHWIRAFGLIDNDRRTADQVAALSDRGVYALLVYSVEALYYHPEVQRRVVARLAAITGEDANDLLADAQAAALASIDLHADRLSERAVEKELREEVLKHLPTRPQIVARTPIHLELDTAAAVNEERARLQEALNSGDLSSIIARYPVRETPALGLIAERLGFQVRSQYESAVRTLLLEDVDALAFARSLFGTLPNALADP